MAKTLLTTKNQSVEEDQSVDCGNQYFQIKRLLSEISDHTDPEVIEARKEIIRKNIGAISYEDLFGQLEEGAKIELETYVTEIANSIAKSIINGLASEEFVNTKLKEYAEQNTSVVFTDVQVENTPDFNELENNHLVSKQTIINKLKSYITSNKLDELEENINSKFNNYYTIQNTYDKIEIDNKLEQNKEESEEDLLKLLKDKGLDATGGSSIDLHFTKPIRGCNPKSMSDLTTKRSVKELLDNHNKDPEAHGNIEKQLNELEESLTGQLSKIKSSTYTRSEIREIITDLVAQKVNIKLAELPTYEYINDSVDNIKQNYIKKDGSTPFSKPQQGEDAIEEKHLVTLRQLEDKLQDLKNSIEKQECYWITSGDVETTVGFFEDNSRVPAKMTIQEVLDRIFYQKRISITVPENSSSGSYIDVTVCVSDPSDIDGAEIFYRKAGEEDWKTEDYLWIEREEFEESSCVTRKVGPIFDDTEFDFRIYQSNGSVYDEYTDTKLSYPVFAGIIPKWMFGVQVKYSDLVDLAKSDPINNKFYDKTKYMRELEHSYSFDLENPVKLVVAIPKDYRNLNKVQNDVQTFNKDAFDFQELKQTTFKVNDKDVLYKLYIYKQPLVRFDSDIVFKFL